MSRSTLKYRVECLGRAKQYGLPDSFVAECMEDVTARSIVLGEAYRDRERIPVTES